MIHAFPPIVEFSRLNESRVSSGEIEKELASALCKQGIFDEAAVVFLKIQAWQEVIDCYTAINDIDRAEGIVREQLAIEPSARLWCALGELCERSRRGKKPLANDTDDAISCYKHALQVDGRSCQAHRCLAALAYKEGRFTDVVKHLEVALSINGMSSASWYTLGGCGPRC